MPEHESMLSRCGWRVEDGAIQTNDVYGWWDIIIERSDLVAMLKALDKAEEGA